MKLPRAVKGIFYLRARNCRRLRWALSVSVARSVFGDNVRQPAVELDLIRAANGSIREGSRRADVSSSAHSNFAGFCKMN
jgi:hypothetical protein